MTYELYYWSGLPGRGEFVRLALEYAGLDYLDLAQSSEGDDTALKYVDADSVVQRPFAPPYLKVGEQLIGQTANILLYLGLHHDSLAPTDEAGRLWTHQLQLTIADVVAEAHDTHHPVGAGLYYEDQKPESKRRAEDFRKQRLPKFLRYFERVLHDSPSTKGWLVRDTATYADLSLFHFVEGVRYAFPKAMARLEPKHRKVVALHDAVRKLPNIAAYLASKRRQPLNQSDLFRHYPELDG